MEKNFQMAKDMINEYIIPKRALIKAPLGVLNSVEPFWKHHRSYCLIFCLEDNQNYIEVVDCYRENKFERVKLSKWKTQKE